MKKLQYSLLTLYGILGALGWYNFYYHESENTYDNLSASLTLSYTRSLAWHHSQGSLQELRSILLTNDLSQKDKVTLRVTNLFKQRSYHYIQLLNGLKTPVPNLGSWYQENFAFNEFIEKVLDIVFSDNDSINEKLHDISDTLEQYQNNTSQSLSNELNGTYGKDINFGA